MPRRFRRPPFALALFAMAALALAVLAAEAFARGGGGGNFGGGGGGGGGFGGGGGGGGGDGGGELLVWLIYLAFRYPAVGVPLLIVFLVVSVLGAKKGRRVQQGRVIRKARTRKPRISATRAVEQLRARDPHFEAGAFRGRVVVAFRKVQSAWCAHDLGPMRPFVSDGIHERFALQIREQQDLGYRDQMEGLDVREVDFAEVQEEGRLQIVTMRIRAYAKDHRVSLDTGKRVDGPVLPPTFVEYWTFLRRSGAKTKDGARGLIEGYCPNCGAPVALNQWSKCEHCSAFLRSGEHDWVLVEITQESEWAPRKLIDSAGVRAVRARDPGFSLQHLEDRASVAFWRAAMAERLGDVAPLRKMATDDACAEREGHIRQSTDEHGTRRWIGERGVGAVEVRAVRPGKPDDRDRAAVEVTWSGTLFARKKDGKLVRERKSGIASTLLVLERAAGVTSDAGTTVSSAHCANCGAPDAGGETDACEYCGEVMNDGTRDWVIAAILRLHSREGRQVLAEIRDEGRRAAARTAGSGVSDTPAGSDGATSIPVLAPPGTHGVVAWMVNAAVADGHLDPDEEKRLVAMAERSRIPHEEVGNMLRAARRGELDAPAPVNREESESWMEEAAAVALADGSVTHGEQKLLVELGRHAGLSPADVRLRISKTRSRLYAEAKQALREDKQR